MSSVVIAGNTSGSVTLQAPNVAGSTTLNLPTVSGGTLVTSDSSGNVGIGTNSPTANLEIYGASSPYQITGNGVQKAFLGVDSGGGFSGSLSNHDFFLRTNNTNQVGVTTAGIFQFNSGYGSVAAAYGCRAWVNFNGQGTVAIRASGNVTSITDNGTGDFTINFTSAMPDTNYTISGGGKFAQFANADLPCIGFFRNTANPILTTSARIGVANLGGGAEDPPVATVTFHR